MRTLFSPLHICIFHFFFVFLHWLGPSGRMFSRGGNSGHLLFNHDLSQVGWPQKQILRWRLVCGRCVRSDPGIYWVDGMKSQEDWIEKEVGLQCDHGEYLSQPMRTSEANASLSSPSKWEKRTKFCVSVLTSDWLRTLQVRKVMYLWMRWFFSQYNF